MNKILPTKYDLIHHNLYLHNILTLKTFKQIIYMSEKMNLFIFPEFHRQEEMSNLLENRITAWLWSEPFNPFDCCWSHWKLSLRLRDRWNFTNSTLTLRESFRSLSANGDHCASFKPRSVNDMTGDLSKIVSWSPAGGTHACFNILYLGIVQITTFQPSSVFLEKWRKRVIMTLRIIFYTNKFHPTTYLSNNSHNKWKRRFLCEFISSKIIHAPFPMSDSMKGSKTLWHVYSLKRMNMSVNNSIFFEWNWWSYLCV
jgi:hypothetical protein